MEEKHEALDTLVAHQFDPPILASAFRSSIRNETGAA